MESLFSDRKRSAKQPMIGLAALLVLPCLVNVGQAQTVSTPVQAEPSPSQQEEQDWREPLLAELARLATALEKEQKFNQILRDRLDILDHRIDQLEEQNSALKDKVGALGEAVRPDAAPYAKPSGQAEIEEGKTPPSAPSGEMELGEGKPDAQAPPTGSPDKNAQKDDGLTENFEQFLDMGEAMMRRFFGVVKEFRKEFDDNRV